MNRLIDWFAQNSVAANILMVVIMAGGLVSIPVIKKEVFPTFSLDMISVSVPYPGAAPAEVEQSVCIRVEEAVQGLEGIERIRSSAVEGACTVTIETQRGYDTRALLDDVKSRVDAIETFPQEAEEPVIRELLGRNQVLNVAISGDVRERSLKNLAERVRDDIAAIPGVTVVEVAAVRPYEISIEVSEQALRRYNLTFTEVSNAVRSASIDVPGGEIETPGGEVLLRTVGQAYRGEQFERIPLRALPGGGRLLLGDVADVEDAFAETDQYARFDGEPAALVQVYRVGEQNVLEIARKVRDYIAAAEPRMPPGVELTVWRDSSEYFRSRLNLLVKNGLSGLALVFVVLALFLKFRLAFWVSLGIPISFLGTMLLMFPLDVSFNMISLFAFILVLGIVVDDAIIVGEDVHTHQSRGEHGLPGATRGAQEVATPVSFAVLTSVAAFTPLLFVPGVSGKVWQIVPLIVIPTLLFSLLESLLILPAHLARAGAPRGSAPPAMFAWWPRFQERFAGGLQWFIQDVYRPWLEVVLRWRYLTLAVALAALLVTAGVVAGGWLRTVFLPNVEADFIVAAVEMPAGTPVQATAAVAERLERSAADLRRRLDAERSGGGSVFRHVLTSIGEQPFTGQERGPGATPGVMAAPHLAEVIIELAPPEERRLSSGELADRWRAQTPPVPAAEITFTASLFTVGEAINIQLSGSGLESLRQAAERLKARLREFQGAYDVADSYRAGQEELRIRIKPAAQHLGLTQAELARQVRQAFYGEEVQRIQRGRHDVRVMVRYPEEQRRSLGAIENMRIRTPDGAEVPFSTVAEVEYGRGFAAIRRVDRQRAINVTADVDPAQANATEIVGTLTDSFLPRLAADYPGLRWEVVGEQEAQRESLTSLARGFLYAILGIYALMAIPFKSYVQPLIVLSVVPFGLVGAVAGHALFGLDLSVLSAAGMVALAGVVVNDSLVLTDYVNRARRRGLPVLLAARQAAAARFRPVLLTSLTTFAGLTPLLLETSLQAQFLIPMAVSLAFGVLFATVITLAIVPCAYLVLEDIKRLARRERSVEQERREDVPRVEAVAPARPRRGKV